MRASVDDLLQLLAARGPMTSPALQAALGVSQPTVSRLIRSAGRLVLRLGRGRNSRYAAVREVVGVGTGARLYAVDENGDPVAVGEIALLAGPVPLVVLAEERWLLGEEGSGEFPGLPYYLHDLRPQGFLGRQIANLLAEQEGVYSGNPEKWSDDRVLRYLCSHGADLPGNLIVGDTALNAFLAGGLLERDDGGLTRFGELVVDECNRVGIVLDGSHTGKRSTLEMIDRSEHPCVFSHSNPSAVVPNPRNIDDEQIKACCGRGGVIGLGLGESRQKLSFLPASHTDFIFCLVGEELGLIGACMLIGLFVFLFIRGISIAGSSNDRFLSYLAYGLTLMISLQALINFAVVTGLVPTKGLPLPFVSYGGSALLMNMAAVGMLLRISKGDEAVSNPTDKNRKTRIMARRNIYTRRGYRS